MAISSLYFVVRLKAILAFQLELAYVWSASRCATVWVDANVSAHQQVSIWKRRALFSCIARNKVYFRRAKPAFRSGSRTEKLDTSLLWRALFVFLADHIRSTSTFQCLLPPVFSELSIKESLVCFCYLCFDLRF